jgi:hypothetical protein
MREYTFKAPAQWATALFYGDDSGLDSAEVAELNAWREQHPNEARDVTGCDDEPHTGLWHGKLTDLLNYQALDIDYIPD